MLPLHTHLAGCLAALLVLTLGLRAGRAEPPPNVTKPAPAATAPAEPSECVLRLKASAVFTPLPAIGGPGECGGEDLVRLEAVLMQDHSRVMLSPPATLRCAMAEAVAQFVRSEVAPAAAELGAPLASLTTADADSCRNRNRAQAGKLSEHARANALDIGAVKLANRTTHSLTSVAVPESFRARMREAACRFFTTVLGPGSDSYHNEHIHLDRAERSRGYRMCQWDIHPAMAAATPLTVHVPLPRPRPLALRQSPQTKTAPVLRRRP
jgi:hypothetical protein